MSENPSVEFLRSELKTNMESFKIRREASKRWAFTLRMIVVALGATITLLLGLKTSPIFVRWNDYFSAVALLLSSLIPIFSAWDAFFDYRWLWVRFGAAQEALYGILDEMEYGLKKGDLSPQVIDDFYQRYRTTLQETTSAWTAHRTTSLESGAAKGSEAG